MRANAILAPMQRFHLARLGQVLFFSLLLFASWFVVVKTTHSGMMATATIQGTDWPWHTAMTEVFYLDTGDPAFSYLAQLRNYPPGAYMATAWFARALGVSPPRAVQLMLGVLCALGCLFAALKVSDAASSWLSLILVAPVLWLLAWLGLGITAHIRIHFFYTQLFSCVLALAGQVLLLRSRLSAWGVAMVTVIVGAVILPCFHLQPALWFLLTGYFVAIARTPNRRSALTMTGAFTVLAAGALAINPAVSTMVQIAANNGDFGVRPNLSPVTVIAYLWVGLLVAAVLTVWRFRHRLKTNDWRVLMERHSGLLAIVLLAGLQMAVLFLLGRGSYYAVKKHLYFVALEFAVLIVTLVGPTQQEPIASRRSTGILWTLFVAILFWAQQPFLTYSVPQREVLRYREMLLPWRHRFAANERRYPQFRRFTPAQNLYLAIGVLGYPGADATTINWWVAGTRGKPALNLPEPQPQ
jgi:hypothetical protein